MAGTCLFEIIALAFAAFISLECTRQRRQLYYCSFRTFTTCVHPHLSIYTLTFETCANLTVRPFSLCTIIIKMIALQVKKKRRQEHPYASVGGGTSQEGGEEEEEEDTEEYDTAEHLLDPARPALGTSNGQRSSGRGRGQWVPPPRRPEDQGRGRGASRQTTPLPPEPPPEIHFSGDSQDSFSAKGYTSISVREPLANLARPSQPVEGNYVTLSETSDEMYAAIEDTVYTHPGGAEEESNDMYSKVDKAKKRGKSTGAEEKPAYATVSKPNNNGSDSRFNPGSQGGELGARPKQRSPCPPSGEAIDYSEYEVAHTDSRAPRFYGQSRDPGYETVPYSDIGQEREPGYETMPQVLSEIEGNLRIY